MRKMNAAIVFSLVALLLCTSCGQNVSNATNKATEKILDPENPVKITIWHYYSGKQQEAFNNMIDKFNETKGMKMGIEVDASGYGTVGDVEDSVQAAIEGNVEAKELPNIFAAYSDTAYNFDKLGKVVDLSQYLSAKEQKEYIDSYIKEGCFNSKNELKLFPIAKSTEIFMLNKTDWNKFELATGASVKDCSTIEGLTRTAKAYYEWTDSLTPELNDGKAFYGRDAMANYMIIGFKQLGHEIISIKNNEETLDFDKETAKKLWDNYYVPFISGYFSSSGRFRSDDVKTGNIIAFTGSSSGATFFPNKVILSDSVYYPIEMSVYESPQFENGESYAVQQGAGMVVVKSSEKEEVASVEFLKWFTGVSNNTSFAINSAYLPVKKEANTMESMRKNVENVDENVKNVIEMSVNTVNDNILYAPPAFEGGTKVRDILEFAMSDKAVTDRAAVVNNLQLGMTLEEAVIAVNTETNFEDWYNTTKDTIEGIIK